MQIWNETKLVAAALMSSDKRNLLFRADRTRRPTGTFSELDTKNGEWHELSELCEWNELGELSEWSEWSKLSELCEVNLISRVSLVEDIGCGAVEIHFQDVAWCDIGCIEKFQDVTCVILDVTLLDTENRKRYRQGNLHRFT